ncbi:MAG: hypothetical protein VB119_07165 [Candidatus Metalachnospira sp.]|nr:hypothetical protein [Candidatus Metalachnospira sp.]
MHRVWLPQSGVEVEVRNFLADGREVELEDYVLPKDNPVYEVLPRLVMEARAEKATREREVI